MRTCPFLFAGLVGLVGVQQAQAQVAFGPQVAWSDKLDLGLGARAEVGLASLFGIEDGAFANLVGAVSGAYFFPDCPSEASCSFVELSPNAAVTFEIDESMTPYAGGGLHVALVSGSAPLAADESSTEIGLNIGLNILGGIKFPVGRMAGFAEGKLGLSGADHFTITAGVLFGGR